MGIRMVRAIGWCSTGSDAGSKKPRRDVLPDHMPRHEDDPRQDQAFAFGYGYIKALIQAV